MTGDPLKSGGPMPERTRVDLDLFSETVEVSAAGSGAGRQSTGNPAVRVQVAQGVTLDGFLRYSLSWRQAAEFIAAIADMLAKTYGRGGFHGALCPEVLLLKDDGGPGLADFGHASGADRSRLKFVGPCTAPERILAEPLPTDPRTDVYAVGIILYHLLCSRYPFRSANQDELCRQIEEDAPQPPRQLMHGIPPELERLCLRMLSKDPSARPANGEELAKELRTVLSETESFGDASGLSAGTIGPRPAANMENESNTENENKQAFVFTWDVSRSKPAEAGPIASRLMSLLRDEVERWGGGVIRQTDVAVVLHLPLFTEGADGLPMMLNRTLAFLAGIAPEDTPVGFAVHTAQPEAAGSAGPSPASATSASATPSDDLWRGLKKVALRMQGGISGSGLAVSPPTMALLRRWLPCRPVAEAEDIFEVNVGAPGVPTGVESGTFHTGTENPKAGGRLLVNAERSQ